MDVRSIDVGKLRTLLSFEGVDVPFNDEDLTLLVESKVKELEGIVNIDIVPRERTKVVGDYCGDILELNFYPVIDIVGVYVNDHPVPPMMFNLNRELGIIYFRDNICGSVRVQYLSGVGDRILEYTIIPLLKDIVRDTIRFTNVNSMIGGYGGLASSLREGDVSVSLSNWGVDGSKGGYGYSGGVNSRIDDLVEKYGSRRARVRWL